MTEHRYFKDLKCALLCLKETVQLVIDSSMEDEGEYVSRCAGIVGVVFRVEEVFKPDFDVWEKEKRYDNICFQDWVGELSGSSPI